MYRKPQLKRTKEEWQEHMLHCTDNDPDRISGLKVHLSPIVRFLNA